MSDHIRTHYVFLMQWLLGCSLGAATAAACLRAVWVTPLWLVQWDKAILVCACTGAVAAAVARCWGVGNLSSVLTWVPIIILSVTNIWMEED